MASISHEHVNQYTGELLPPSPAAAPYAIFKQSSDTVRTSVIIGLGSKLAVLQAQQVRNITSYNEIDLELPGKQKCAYFCIVSDQDSTFDFLSSLFFSFLFIRLIRYADGYCEGGMLSTKVKFVLDEFPNCCLIPDFTKKCSTIRSRGCSVAVFFQNVGQMRNRYPDDQWQEILGACDSTVFWVVPICLRRSTSVIALVPLLLKWRVQCGNSIPCTSPTTHQDSARPTHLAGVNCLPLMRSCVYPRIKF